MDSTMVVIDINAHELAEFPCASQLSEIRNESQRESRQTDNCTVDIDDERSGTIDLCTSGETDI